jgi:hypothetical protein
MIRSAAIPMLAILLAATRVDALPAESQFDELAATDPNVDLHADEWALRLKQDPTYSGYFIAFEASAGQSGAARTAAHKALVYLVVQHGIDPSRLHEMTGPAHQAATIQFWMVPEGGSPPVPQ